MNATNQLKVLLAGFTIIRERNLEIYAKTPDQTEWHKLEGPFSSYAARDRRMVDLMRNSAKVVED